MINLPWHNKTRLCIVLHCTKFSFSNIKLAAIVTDPVDMEIQPKIIVIIDQITRITLLNRPGKPS